MKTIEEMAYADSMDVVWMSILKWLKVLSGSLSEWVVWMRQLLDIPDACYPKGSLLSAEV
jgi:hypothetical protein